MKKTNEKQIKEGDYKLLEKVIWKSKDFQLFKFEKFEHNQKMNNNLNNKTGNLGFILNMKYKLIKHRSNRKGDLLGKPLVSIRIW